MTVSGRPLMLKAIIPAFTRLSRLARLDPVADAALRRALVLTTTVPPRREMVQEGMRPPKPRVVISGWAARVRILGDGRRQFLSFILPGELIGNCRRHHLRAVSTVVALTSLTISDAPPAETFPALAMAYDVSAALEEGYLLAQIVRLGRMTAQERIEDLLLELHDRMAMSGLAQDDGFALPLTQEMLADALGLTPVHINRMVQAMRRDSGFTWKSGHISFENRNLLSRKLGYTAPELGFD